MKKPQPQSVQLLGETESRGGVRSAVKQIWDYLRSFSEADYRFKAELYEELTPRYAQARYAPSVLASGDEAVVTLTVTGVLPGYFVEATYDEDLQGVQLTASVDALDTVHVLFQNDTGGSITLAAGKIRVYVWPRPLSDEDSPFASESVIGGGGGGGGYTDEQAQDAVGNILVDTNSIDFTYTDATPEIKADLKKQNSASIDLSIDASGLKAVLKDTAVIPGGYASANIVVDQQGRIIAAADGSGGSGSGSPPVFRPYMNEPPASNFATLDTRNSHPVLDFDGATDEEGVFSGVLPASYAGGGLTVSTWWSFTSATSGSFRVQAAIERMNTSSLDIDVDSFAAFQSAGGTAPGTSGQVIKVDVVFTDGAQMDSLAAGEPFRLKIRRDADGTSGTDDITTDAELLMVRVT